jgi:hypothetical protein
MGRSCSTTSKAKEFCYTRQPSAGCVIRDAQLGGLLSFYRRAAA